MKIVILDGFVVNPGDLSWDYLREFGDVTVYDRSVGEDVIGRIGDAQIVMTNKTPLTEDVFAACPNLRLVCVLATGYNVVDCEAAKKRGIVVCNVPDYGTAAVAQFTFSLLLELCNAVGRHSESVHSGKWTKNKDFCYWETPQVELAGKTMGIIGFGRIGRAVGKIAKAMGMNVIAYNRSRSDEGEQIGTYVDLQYLLQNADVISLHCPLTAENKELIGSEAIAKMKDGAMLLNTARGPLIDEGAVRQALESGKLSGFAADVVTVEPIPADSPLLHAPNCILTPHMAWAPRASRQRIMECTQKNIRAFLQGKPINTVNF